MLGVEENHVSKTRALEWACHGSRVTFNLKFVLQHREAALIHEGYVPRSQWLPGIVWHQTQRYGFFPTLHPNDKF